MREAAYRSQEQVKLCFEKHHICKDKRKDPPAPVIRFSNDWIAQPIIIKESHLYLEYADRMLEGRLTVFKLDVDAYELIENWNRDPKTRTEAPLLFGKTIDYNDKALVGEIKYLWEPNRHLHFVPLAQAYSLSGKRIYLKGLKLHLESWLDQCPYPFGPNWSSSLEAAIRLINWSIAWQLIGGIDSALFKDSKGEILKYKWLYSIFHHMEFITKYFSRYSSANNHLIGEAAGLFIATNTWPFWSKTSDNWRNIGFSILVDESLKQIAPDGGSREQAISYQQFVLDFLILSMLSGSAKGIKFPQSYTNRIERMLEFIASMMDVKGNLPMIGDADDGYVVKMSMESNFSPYKSLLCSGAVLFQRMDFFRIAKNVDDKTRWLFGNVDEKLSKTPRKGAKLKRFFQDTGYYVIGKRFGKVNEVKCIIDCGPLGYSAIAAHGHSDALSIYLSIGGVEFLIDPGTYSYHSENKWRNYFRGTSAHNTVRIDHADQSLSGGKFMWIHKANAKMSAFDIKPDADEFEGYHDGYRRLHDPVIHKRKVVFNKRSNRFLVFDIIECSKEHTVERFWHFHENCTIESDKKELTVQNNGLKIKITSDGIFTLYQGNEALPRGWISRRYDEKFPTVTAVVKKKVLKKTILKTKIQLL